MQITRFIILLLVTYGGLASTDIYMVDDSNGLGRQFDGIGGISGGGATSKLLVNYPEPQRSEILDYLFKPNFAASLQILKVEIGGDGQSTDGTEASHMHDENDQNFNRGYEWWLMVEAKKRNPDIKIYGLPWAFPGWLNLKGERDPYRYPNLTSHYIITWINGAKSEYDITVDYIGIWNEKAWEANYIKVLRSELNRAGLQHVKIVAPDAPHINDWKICVDLMKDPELAAAVDIVGCHYPGTITTATAVESGKPLWASEDYSTFNDLVGGGCWARLLNQNFVNGNITGTISWNLIAAYYETLPFTRDGLMTAESPWSGKYVVESPIWMTAHHTQFSEIGWKYFPHGNGSGHLTFGGSYVSLTSPDKKHLTIIIETMSHDHSKCIRPALPPYHVQKQDVKFILKGQFENITELEMWKTSLRFAVNSTFFKKQKNVKVVDGAISLTLDVDDVITLTTVTTGNKGSHPTPPPAKAFPLPYIEDFERYNVNDEPYNFAQQTGAFEVIGGVEGHNNVMRQMVLRIPIYWCSAEKLNMAITIIGSQKWSDIYIQTDVRLYNVNPAKGYFIAARVWQAGCWLYESTGIFFFVYPESRLYVVTGNISQADVIMEGPTGELDTYGWNTMKLLVQSGWASGVLNDKVMFNISTPTFKTHGFVGVGTSSWGHADFDNIQVADPKDARIQVGIN